MAQYPSEAPETSFIQKLRMSNIYPVGKTGTQTYNMPDFQGGGGTGGGGGQDDFSGMLETFRAMRNKIKEDDQNRAIRQRMQFGPESTGNQMRQQALMRQQATPMGYRTGVNESALGNIGASIMGPTVADKEVLQMKQKPDLMKGEAALKGVDVDIRRAELAEKIAAGQATDREKQEYEMAQIEARNKAAMAQQELQGQQQMNVQGLRGQQEAAQLGSSAQNAQMLEWLRNKNEKEQIRERVGAIGEESRIKQSAGPMDRNERMQKASDIIRAREDLAPYIEITPSGAVNIDPNAPIAAWNEINSAMNQRDIYLPAEKYNTGGGATRPTGGNYGGGTTRATTPTSRTPTSTTPTDPLGIR